MPSSSTTPFSPQTPLPQPPVAATVVSVTPCATDAVYTSSPTQTTATASPRSAREPTSSHQHPARVTVTMYVCVDPPSCAVTDHQSRCQRQPQVAQRRPGPQPVDLHLHAGIGVARRRHHASPSRCSPPTPCTPRRTGREGRRQRHPAQRKRAQRRICEDPARVTVTVYMFASSAHPAPSRPPLSRCQTPPPAARCRPGPLRR